MPRNLNEIVRSPILNVPSGEVVILHVTQILIHVGHGYVTTHHRVLALKWHLRKNYAKNVFEKPGCRSGCIESVAASRLMTDPDPDRGFNKNVKSLFRVVDRHVLVTIRIRLYKF